MGVHTWRRGGTRVIGSGPVVVIGIGDERMADSGLGPAAIELLRERFDLRGAVRLECLEDGGAVAGHCIGARAVVLAGAVRENLVGPGAIRFYRGPELLVRAGVIAPEQAPGLPADALFVGAVPGSLAPAPGLTDHGRTALPLIVQGLVGELERLGIAVRLRAPAAAQA